MFGLQCPLWVKHEIAPDLATIFPPLSNIAYVMLQQVQPVANERRKTMPNLIEFFTSFSGRISRKSWWIGYVILLVLGLGGTLLLNPSALSLDPVAVYQPNWADTIWSLLLLIPYTAITVKRFNDGDWPNWLGYAVCLILALSILGDQFGFVNYGPELSTTDWIYLVVIMLISLFVLIVNGFLRGTTGPNRYGPDPLQST